KGRKKRKVESGGNIDYIRVSVLILKEQRGR
ncbi:ribosome biogenesis GTPase YlqF, partial [Clostridium botulinum]|nr:ribosome biogenesis GTPase YlqF [Clostridium botulinum]